VGAHFDHLGRGGDGSLAPGERGAIHNGADDNASGTACVLELARGLASGPPPAGDVVFALWDAEELGLLGSEHFVRNPTIPLDEIDLCLNLDMVGRAGSGRLQVLGAGSSPVFGAWMPSVAEAAELELDVSLGGHGVGGSDHQTFLRAGVPALHLFSGLHADYHRPSDDVEGFEAEGAARVVRLCAELVASAQHEADLPFLAAEEPAGGQGQPGRGFRVKFGSIPSYVYPGPGVLISGTSPASPAEKAGLRGGDVLLRIGDVRIDTMHDFVHVLQTYNPGDVVLTRYQRDGVEEQVLVTLEGRALE
jgi:hypothetical protein